MKHVTLILPIILALVVSYSTHAEISTAHSIGLTISGGGIDYKGKDTDGVGVAQSYLYYNYQFSPHYYLEVGMTNSEDIDDWECDRTGENSWDCRTEHNNSFALDADNYSQDGLIIAVKTDLALSKRNSLYAKVGAELYQYELSLAQNKFADESGVGLFVEAGWEYRWDNHIGINAGVWHHDLGDLESTSINLGMSYAF